jgi:hypothetical protein
MAASVVLAVLLASALAGAAAGGDIVHQDDQAPKIPGCSNDFVLVIILFPCPLRSPPPSLALALFGFTVLLPDSDFPRQVSCYSLNCYSLGPRVSKPNELPSGGEFQLNRIRLPIHKWMDA